MQALLLQRRDTANSNECKVVPKRIQKTLRKLIRKHNDEKVEHILKDLQNLEDSIMFFKIQLPNKKYQLKSKQRNL